MEWTPTRWSAMYGRASCTVRQGDRGHAPQVRCQMVQRREVRGGGEETAAWELDGDASRGEYSGYLVVEERGGGTEESLPISLARGMGNGWEEWDSLCWVVSWL